MKICLFKPALSYSLGVLLGCGFPTLTQQGLATPLSESSAIFNQNNRNNLIKKLTETDIIYLGETHNNVKDHQAQLQLIQALFQQNPKIAIAMEMFQRPYQNILDQYLTGEITESQLIEQSQYHQRWGFPWENYAEIVRFAQQQKIPILAINTPTEITRKVAREGLERLTKSEQQYIPPLSEIDLNPSEYREMLLKIYQQHHQGNHGNSENFERFFQAQILWDETMADAIANFVKNNPDFQVIVLAGQGHIVYGYGIPNRVKRRFIDHPLIQKSILFQSQDEEFLLSEDSAIADFIWQHEANFIQQ
ncbi:ChaN family lipoprotein [Planktothrix sp. FACHB-1365]|uniref:ChaN family lipoprotein n=1 Tax=Planktothrix sp. FACHB-1365 TaxID=2692855 RepID=UPI0016863A85|nr:ChaN family lipoprotein [Planktothrix sp. FACHB-1365]MBD2481580.1 ChaN family lipoprotein [Planktothrix sp. FACHB-1365]